MADARLYSLLKDMVDIYSPSGKEHELTDFLHAYLREHLSDRGCSIALQNVSDDRSNILIQTPGELQTLFLGHIDTVPAYDIENYQLNEYENLLYGLGTADMKSGCAAMIEAFTRLATRNALPEGVMLALVVGEEETGDGTQALLESHSFTSALVAEPTNLQPCLEHYGYTEILVQAFGYRRHAAMSGKDTNAIHAMLRYLLQLEDYIDTNEPETVLNIRDLHSSESGFAVPDRCSAGLDLHIPPGVDTADYAEKLRVLTEEILDASRCTGYELEFPTLADGYRLMNSDTIPRLLRQVFDDSRRDWNTAAFTSHSDANLLYAAGCRPVILGPGELAKAHTRDESVAFEQVEAAADIYSRLLTLL